MTGGLAAGGGWSRPAWLGRLGTRTSRRVLAGVLLVAILIPAALLRFEVAADRSHHASADEKAYVAVAAGLRQHGVYGSQQLKHPFHWAPGAPALFAVSDLVSGHRADGRIDVRAARRGQAVVGTLTVVAAFGLAALLAGAWAGLAAAAAVAFYPPMIDATSALISETLGAFAICAALVVVVWAWRSGGGWRMFAAGVALALACLVRADVLLGALAVALAIGILRWRRDGRGPGLRSAAAVLAGLLVLLVPWSVYASRRERTFVPITDGGASTLFVATYLPGHGTIYGLKHALLPELVRLNPRYRHVPIQRIPSSRFLDAVAMRHPKLGRNAAITKELRRNLRVYVLGHPWAFTKLTVKKVWRMWNAPFRGSYHRYTTATLWVHRGLLALALLGVLGALWRRRTRALLLVLVAVVVVAIVDIAFVAEARHAFRLMPSVLAAGAAGWALLLARRGAPA
ncbi:MAG: hypothetical protein ACXVSX_03345 [Solirubrobacteraceae bacterium]